MSRSGTRRLVAFLVPVALLVVAATAATSSSASVPSATSTTPLTPAQTAVLAEQIRSNTVSTQTYTSTNACAANEDAGLDRRLACRAARLATADDGQPVESSAPAGYTSAELRSAYGAADISPRATIAIFAAGLGGNVVQDTQKYRQETGLPACGDCLEVIGYPTTPWGPIGTEDDWGANLWNYAQEATALEAALDVQAATAVCPTCKIKLFLHPLELAFTPLPAQQVSEPTNWTWRSWAEDVKYFAFQANQVSAAAMSASYAWDLTSAPDDIKREVTSLSFGGARLFASSGDDGYMSSDMPYAEEAWPATATNAVAVGGTSLYRDEAAPSGYTEHAWIGSGSTCSSVASPPAGQPGIASSLCDGHRATSDMAADADPLTGLAVYSSYSPFFDAAPGWQIVGGTSASAPLAAALYASATWNPHGGAGPYDVPSTPAAVAWHDVTTGVNAVPADCRSALCVAKPGWDGPTGVGTPANAYAAFNGGMRLMNVATGRCLDLGPATSGAASAIATCGTTKTHLTPLFRGAPGSGAISVAVTGTTCLGVNNGSRSSGAALAASDCSAAGARWVLTPVTPGSSRFVIQNAASLLCADIDQHAKRNGTAVTQQRCTGGAWQQWDLLPLMS